MRDCKTAYPSVLISIDQNELIPVVRTSNKSTSGVHHWDFSDVHSSNPVNPKLEANNILLSLLPPVAQKIRFSIFENTQCSMPHKKANPHREKSKNGSKRTGFQVQNRGKIKSSIVSWFLHKPSLLCDPAGCQFFFFLEREWRKKQWLQK